jgi:hypothetical protein
MMRTKNRVVQIEKISNIKVYNRYVPDEEKQVAALRKLLKHKKHPS